MWMNLANVMPSERNQVQKSYIPFTGNTQNG